MQTKPRSGINFYIQKSPSRAHPECACVSFHSRVMNACNDMVVKLQLFAGFSGLLSTKVKLEQRWVETTSFRLPAPSPCLVGLWDFFVLLHLLCLSVFQSSDDPVYWPAFAKRSNRCHYSVKPKNVWSEKKDAQDLLKTNMGTDLV